MSKWKSKKLLDVAYVIRGVTFDKGDVSDSISEGLVPILRAGNIGDKLDTKNDLVYVPAYKVGKEQLLQVGDVAICMSSGSPDIVGKTSKLEEPWYGSVGAFCAIIRFNQNVLPRFGAIYFQSLAFKRWRKRQAEGANIKNLRKSDLESLMLPVPTLTEQERIVHILDEAEEMKWLRAKANDRTADLIPTLFDEMFGDFSKNSKGFPVFTIDDIAEVKGGKRLPKGEEFSEKATPYKYIRVVDINEGWIDETNLKYITPDIQSQIARYTVTSDDIVITIAGTIGVVAPVTRSLNGVNLTENAAKLVRRNSSQYDTVFLTHAMLTPFVQSQILGHTGQVTIGKLALFRIQQIKIPIPPIALQKEFTARVEEIHTFSLDQSVAEQKLESLFQSLLHRAFEGEL